MIPSNIHKHYIPTNIDSMNWNTITIVGLEKNVKEIEAKKAREESFQEIINDQYSGEPRHYPLISRYTPERNNLRL